MRPTNLRLGALLAAAGLGVHELRYRMAFGEAAAETKAAHGHAYLATVTAVVAVSLAFALAAFVLQIAGRTRAPAATGRRRERLLAVAGALLLLYVAQELLEGWLSSGHPTGLAGVFGQGGWTAIPLALVAATLVCGCLMGAEAVLMCGRRARAPMGGRARSITPRRSRAPWSDRCPVGRFLVGRAPPLVPSR